MSQEERQERAERILDAAAELLLRFGYRKVTIDDVATQAGIGKGTVYLHWKTREALFQSVFRRELAAAADELVATLQSNPREIRLHRVTRANFLAIMRRPLLKAMVSADVTILGKLTQDQLETRHEGATRDYIRLLADHSLIRSPLPIEDMIYAWHATLGGFFFEAPHPEGVERAATILAATILAAFEPRLEPSDDDLKALAPQVIDLFTEIRDLHRAAVRRAYE
ncbi:MAG TPA: helix-turn-helix domain-containing protein [Amycolatopsis sp.]|nr:helix-turn-helix domain-containing protein [Amycolatopsis sp.]